MKSHSADIQHHSCEHCVSLLLLSNICGESDRVAHHCWTVHLPSRLSVDEYQREGYDKCTAVAHEVIAPFEVFELLGIVFFEKSEIDVLVSRSVSS